MVSILVLEGFDAGNELPEPFAVQHLASNQGEVGLQVPAELQRAGGAHGVVVRTERNHPLERAREALRIENGETRICKDDVLLEVRFAERVLQAHPIAVEVISNIRGA